MDKKFCKCGKPITSNRTDHMGKPLTSCDECFNKALEKLKSLGNKDKK